MICEDCGMNLTNTHTRKDCVRHLTHELSAAEGRRIVAVAREREDFQRELASVKERAELLNNLSSGYAQQIGELATRCCQLEDERDAALARANAAEILLEVYRIKRAVDGLNKRTWSASPHYYANFVLDQLGEVPMEYSWEIEQQWRERLAEICPALKVERGEE